MTNIPTEYIIAALLGLGGAALYHLFWPVMRGLWAVVYRIAYIAVRVSDYITLKDIYMGTHERQMKWYPKPTPDDSLFANRISFLERSLDARTERWDRADGLAQTRIAALEERMDAVENVEHLDGPLAHAIMALAERGGSLSIQTPKVPYGSPVPTRSTSAGLPNTTIW